MSDESKYPTRIAPYGLRMPDDLKARVQAAADANNRSMNAEIVAALGKAFPAVEFNYVAVQTMVDTFQSTGDPAVQKRMVEDLQDFLRAYRGDVSVYIDDDGEIILKGTAPD